MMSLVQIRGVMAGNFVIGWFVAKNLRQNMHCYSLSSDTAKKMIPEYAVVIDAIQASHSVPIVMTTCVYRTILDTICSATKRWI